MQYLIIFITIGILLVAKLIYDEKNTYQIRKNRIINNWGKVPDEEYTSEKFQSLGMYYRHFPQSTTHIDDITWNDIDMDEIFMLLNNTCSAIGEEYLYSLLRRLVYDPSVLEERERLIQYFLENKEKRIELQMALSNMGKLQNISIYEYINRVDHIEVGNKWKHYAHAFSFLGSILLTIASPFLSIPIGIGILLIIFCLGNNIVRYYKEKAKVEAYFSIFSYVLRLLSSVKALRKLKIQEISDYTKELEKAEQAFQKFKRGAGIVIGGKNMSGSLADIMLDYIRMFFHIDLIKFQSMLVELQKNKQILNLIFENIGILDGMLAIASFRTYLEGEYCIPTLKKVSKPYIKAVNLYHPLIENPITNTIEEQQCVLITGSNASGKSTFIKTIAINAILAQTIHMALGQQYEASFFKIYSSMALRDNLLGKESYYIVEIKSLKRILDQLETQLPTLCFVDEVLRGTNTLERIAASTQILYHFSKKNALCFAATHDIELTYILEHAYSNYHFQEQIKENEIMFDYKLHAGRAVSRNAIKLLRILGYEEEIIQKATLEANVFLEKGIWNPME